ncbi:MAG: extracellular solute-binding protein [Actinomycetota bacterium]
MELARRRPRVVTLVLTGVLALVGAGCAGESDDAATTLRVLMTDDWVTAPFVSAVKDFERDHPGVRVEVERAPISHMLDTVSAQTRDGQAPDVVQAHAFSAAAQGLAQPVDDLWEASLKTSEFLPGAIDDVTWGDRLYGVPLDTNAMFLIVNKEHYQAAGLTPPSGRSTFEEFEATARSLAAAGGERRAIAIPTSTWWTYGWIKANGGEVISVDPGGQVRLSLDAPEVVEALDFLSRLVKAGLAFPPQAADSHSNDALSLFRSGRAATLASGSWDLSILGKDPGAARYDSALLPQGADASGTAMGGSSLFVPTGSDKRELAFEFMAHLVSDRYALRLAKEEGRLPVRPRVYEDPYFKSPALATVIEQLPSASPFKLTAFPDAHDVFAGAVDEILRTGADATAAMKDAQQRAQALVPPKSP